MNIEIGAYALVIASAVALALPPVERAAEKHIVPISMLVFLALSLVVRFSPPSSDFDNYFGYLSQVGGAYSFEWREPIIWFGSRAINAVVNSPATTYVILDVLCFGLVVSAFNRMKLPVYAFVAVMAFFPFFMGMQNVYRQWAATCLLIYAVANSDRGMMRAGIAFTLALATHNVSIVFAGLLVPALPPRWRMPAMLACFALMPVIMFVGGATKSAISTGLDLQYAYVAIVAAIGATCIGMQWRQEGHWNGQAAMPYIYMMYIVAAGTVVLASAPAERVGLSCFLLLYPSIVILPDAFSGWRTPAGRVVIALGGFAPILLVGARGFLF